MITWIRSAAVAPGRMGDAVAFVREVSKFIGERHAIAIAVSRPLAGNPTRIFWSSQHPDLEGYARDHRAINADADFQRMLAGASDCFLAGTTYDEILQSLDA